MDHQYQFNGRVLREPGEATTDDDNISMEKSGAGDEGFHDCNIIVVGLM